MNASSDAASVSDQERFRSATAAFRALNEQRLEAYPAHPFFIFADRELRRIEERRSFDRRFYRSLNLGLMCARELETVDPSYCNAAYALLECVRVLAKA